jgi:hypothetical protein
VKGNVEEGVAATKALLDRYDELNMKLGEDLTPEQMDKVLEEQGRLQDKIDAVNAWEIDSQLELAMDALRCPPADADVRTLSAASAVRSPVPSAPHVAGSAAARRADQPPRCRVGRVARALPQGIQGHRRRSDARSLLPG